MEIEVYRMEGKAMTRRSNCGQAFLECALFAPALLIILLGGYASVRTAILKSRAESAAITETLRAGRNLPGIGRDLSRSVLPDDRAVQIRNARGRNALPLPPPLPSFAGRSSATVTLRKEWREIGTPRWLPTAHIERTTELGADCWERETPSGKKARGWIRAVVLLGAIR